MFVPIGLDQTSVRRLPWVSIAIIATNLVVFLLLSSAMGTAQEETTRRARELLKYWSEHSYLTLPKSIAPEISQAEREHLRLVSEAMRSMPGRTGATAADREAEQRELDTLADRFMEAKAQHPVWAWGLVPADPKPLAFITCLFVHASWLHLLGNMLFFYLTGPFLEDAWGRPLFAAFYLASGIVASLVFIAAFPHSTTPLVGASGAIAGVMGAFLVRFVRRKVRFFYIYFMVIFRTGTVDLPAWLVLPLWFLEQLFFAGLSRESGVAYRAHIGGFGFGFAAALVLKLLRVEERFIAPRIEREISVSQHPALDEGMELMLRGDSGAARAAFARVLAAEPHNADAHLGVWQSHCADGTVEQGAPHLVQAIEEEVRRGDTALALEHWRELVASAHRNGPPALRWRLAAGLEAGNRAAAIELLRSLAGDAAAGVLAEKAARRLEALGVAAPSAGAPAAGGGTGSPQPPVTPPPAATTPPPAPEPAAAPAPAGRELEVCGLEALEPEGVLLRGGGGATELLPFDQVEAISVAGIAASPRPFLVLDLVLRREAGQPRRVQRLLSHSFNPRAVLGRPDLSGMDAFRLLVTRVADGSRAPVWPEGALEPSAHIPTFSALDAYEGAALARFD